MGEFGGIYHIDKQPVTDRLLLLLLSEENGSAIQEKPSGIYIDGSVGMGYCISNGCPVSSPQSKVTHAFSCWIVFDGWIDNSEEIADQLENDESASPTSVEELILGLYRLHGERGFERILGNFAFAIWDTRKEHLLCVRDPVGLRTVFYFFDNRTFLWASTIRQLINHPIVRSRALNENYIADFLVGAPIEGEETIYTHIHRLPPGHHLTVSREGIQTHCYWEINPHFKIRYSTDEEYEEHFKGLFREAVRCCLRGPQPIGTTLSGGLDSSSIACVARDIYDKGELNGELWSFSHTYDDLSLCDERPFIDAVVEYAGIKRWQHIQGDELWPLKSLPASQDEPFQHLFYDIVKSLLQQTQKDGIRILLRGDGGDELVRGNSYYLLSSHEQKILSIAQSMRHLSEKVIPCWLEHSFVKRTDLRERLRNEIPIQFDDLSFQTEYEKYKSGDICVLPLWLSQYIARPLSIELRFPFLDRRLVEFFIALPVEQKYRIGQTKSILRRSLSTLLPEPVRARTSKTDLMPLTRRGLEREWEFVKLTITAPEVSNWGILKANLLLNDLASIRDGQIQQTRLPWLALCLCIWIEHYYTN
jgi:asparagine synthase (glutamine-hydrolysing)